jgi:hypothetical protein
LEVEVMRDGKTLVALVALVVLCVLGVVALTKGGSVTASPKRVSVVGGGGPGSSSE